MRRTIRFALTTSAGRTRAGDTDAFVLPDLGEELARVDHYTSVAPQEKLKAREEVYQRYAQKSELLHSFHALLKSFSCLRGRRYVVQDGKSLSSTSSPAG